MAGIKISVDVRQLEAQATRLDRVAEGGRLALAATQAVNSVTTRFEKKAVAGEIANINLTQAYVRSKTDMTLARPGGPARAQIRTKGDLTILGRFEPLSRIIAPGAARRAGPVKGFRQAGTALGVTKTGYHMEPQWFIMRLRAGREPGVNFGVFVRDDSIAPKSKRDGRAGYRHIYGPSPYSLFHHQINVGAEALEEDLRATALDEMGGALKETL